MGFRRIRDMNLALLGKQDWRFLTRTNSFVSRVYKARYYPTTSFFQAEAGSNPSFVWRGLLEAKEVLRRGCRRSIGDGRGTKIGEVPWLPDVLNPYVITPLHESVTIAPVSSLLNVDGTGWDYDCVRDIFDARDAALIMKLPLSTRLPPDSWYWADDHKGNYTVRSYYRRLVGEANDSRPWARIWSLQVPPKVTCHLCHQFEESALHLFATCSEAVKVWAALGLLIVPTGTGNVSDWFFENLSNLDGDNLCKFVMACWGLWCSRNDSVWRNVPYSMDLMLRSALSLWSNWKCANEGDAPAVQETEEESWKPPSFGCLKLNTDVAMSSNGSMGMGWVVRDEMGTLVAAKSSNYVGDYDVKEAKAVSIREALSWVKALDYGSIDVETDSQIVFYALSSPSYNSPFSLIIDDVKEAASLIQDVVFSFARRSANRAAHALAREGVSLSGNATQELFSDDDLGFDSDDDDDEFFKVTSTPKNLSHSPKIIKKLARVQENCRRRVVSSSIAAINDRAVARQDKSMEATKKMLGCKYPEEEEEPEKKAVKKRKIDFPEPKKHCHSHTFGILVDDIKESTSMLNNVVFHFVKQSANRAAHLIAREAVYVSGCGEWIDIPLPFLVACLSVDAMN
ncbi:PREDICTED: uncharacterized protein LOC109170919 [Ipomoea nil]|uniref:uncharacterized protein LOC109170919 n=1 Tax=Ipomoea nil TaxID=35883 RepID=UPI000900E201|nr:PREDICTED: uncharacterized protein LOC109170919 [Ipomoea nil]